MNSFAAQLKALAKFLSAEKIPYVILGGVAVLFYGEPRLTADIDVNILLSKERILHIIKQGKKYGIYPLTGQARKIAEKTGVLPLRFRQGHHEGKIDLIFAGNVLEYNAIRRGRWRTVSGIRVKMISPDDLVIHKMVSSRAKDLEDAKGIIWRQGSRLDSRYIISWLRRIDRIDQETHRERLFSQIRKDKG